jgi:hypothetical protein
MATHAVRLDALVQAKQRIELERAALRDLGRAQVLADEALTQRMLRLREYMAALDRQIANLDDEDRWRFMLGCMLRGELTDL